jgi:hypothetical protein
MPKTPDFKSNRTFNDIISEGRRPRPLPETGWNYVGPSEAHGVNFQNGWANVGASSVPASWYLSEDGEVRLRGRLLIQPTTIALGWGAAYKVGDDIPAGSKINVDYSSVDGVLAVAAAVQEIQGLDFGVGDPSATPWEDSPFNGSISSGGTVDASRIFHVPLGVVGGHDFRLAGWKGMQVATKRYPNAIDWDSPTPWTGAEYHSDGGLVGEGGMDLFSHLGWRFVDQVGGTTDIEVSIELVDTFTGEQYVYGLSDIKTSGTVTVSSTFDTNITPSGKEVDVTLSNDITAPSGLAVITILAVDDDWPGPADDAASWPTLSDTTGSPNNFGKGRVLTAAQINL